MPVLFEKSGAEGQYRRFKFEMLKLAEKDELPGYALSVETAKDGEPMLRMRRVDGKGGAGTVLPEAAAATPEVEALPPVSPGKPAEAHRQRRAAASPKTSSAAALGQVDADASIDARKLIRSTVAGLSDAATRGFMTDETIDLLRRECPGWDLHALHADFERWVFASSERTPADWQRAFIGWVRRHHAKHGRQIRG